MQIRAISQLASSFLLDTDVTFTNQHVCLLFNGTSAALVKCLEARKPASKLLKVALKKVAFVVLIRAKTQTQKRTNAPVAL